jgi:hypothetical protein
LYSPATKPPTEANDFEKVPKIRSTSLSIPKCSAVPRPPAPEHAGGVGVVDDHARPVALREFDDPRQLGDVAVHREDAVGHDQASTRLVGVLVQQPLQVVDIAVVVAPQRPARQSSGVVQAGVVLAVVVEDVVAPGEGADHRERSEEARAERQRRRLAEEGRQAPLELLVQRQGPGQEP